jgi:hypothetical protein
LHYLFPYGAAVNRGLAAATERLQAHSAGRTEGFNHIVVRLSGDVGVGDRGILAKLVQPLSDPSQPGVCISSAVQTSDWEQDELVRRWLVKPRMEACLAAQGPLIPCSSSAPQGSLSAYMAPILTVPGVSETWGGGEDGVGFTLLDPRIRGVIVRDARVWHCHAGRSRLLQWQVLGEWLCTGIVNKLNGLSGKLGADQARAYRYFMTHGILGRTSAGLARRLGRFVGHTTVTHAARLAHTLVMAALMTPPLAGAALRRRCYSFSSSSVSSR